MWLLRVRTFRAKNMKLPGVATKLWTRLYVLELVDNAYGWVSGCG